MCFALYSAATSQNTDESKCLAVYPEEGEKKLDALFDLDVWQGGHQPADTASFEQRRCRGSMWLTALKCIPLGDYSPIPNAIYHRGCPKTFHHLAN